MGTVAVALTLLASSLPLPQGDPGSVDSVYATPRIRQVVELAARAHARPPEGLTSFDGSLESEIAVLVQRTGGEEMASQVEQFSGRVVWERSGSVLQFLTGYRALFVGPSFSVLSSLEVPWVVPPLYGDRIPLIFGPGDEEGEERSGGYPLVHPFASDREAFYRYSGGDTVLTLGLRDRTVPLVRVGVDIRRVPDSGAVFSGQIFLDASRHRIVRMRGHLVRIPGRRSPLAGLLDRAMEEHFFLELENAEREGHYWLPYRQRIEIHARPAFSEDGAILRLVSRFRRVELNSPVPEELLARDDPGGARILKTWAPDSLQSFRGWRRDLGAATAERDLRDFDDVAPPALRARGPPVFDLRARALSDLLRYNRVEGLFTGIGLSLNLRDAAPGVFVNARGGYAWAESAVRGGGEVGLTREPWTVSLLGERRLVSTNDFPRPFMERPTIFGIFGQDDFDYVDRLFAGTRVSFDGRRGPSWELKGGMARDREPRRAVAEGPLWGEFRTLRPVREGDFAFLRMTASLGRADGSGFITPGLGGSVTWEVAHGDLDWQRLESVVHGRLQRGPWILAGDLLGGLLFGKRPPPQALFELGSYQGRLPGYDYKAFSGDRAAVLGAQLMYLLPVASTPVSVAGFVLPGLSPSVSLESRTGWVGSSSFVDPVLEELGWTDSDGLRSSLFLGVRFFGGAVGVGFGGPVTEGGRWRIEVVAGPGL